MIDGNAALALVQKFAGLDRYPRAYRGASSDERSEAESAMSELVVAMQTAKTQTIAASIVHEWLLASPKSPTPADLYRLIGEANEKSYPQGCTRCNGWGIYREYQIGPDGEVTGFAWRFCACAEGERLLRAEPDAVDRMNGSQAQAAGGAA